VTFWSRVNIAGNPRRPGRTPSPATPAGKIGSAPGYRW
jgi:hypothetical protein